MSTTNPVTGTPPGGAPNDPSPAVYRRLLRALADLGLCPQPVGGAAQPWVELATHDGTPVVTFAPITIAATARLANLLEDIAAGVAITSVPSTDFDTESSEHDPDSAAEYVLAPFEPVAAPLEPFHVTSRHHPRTAW